MKSNEFEKEQVIRLKDAVAYQEKAIVSRIVTRNEKGNITIFAFDEGESLSEHTAPFDAFVQVLDGEGRITINRTSYDVSEGDCIIMPADLPHAVLAKTAFKMMLVMIKA